MKRKPPRILDAPSDETERVLPNPHFTGDAAARNSPSPKPQLRGDASVPLGKPQLTLRTNPLLAPRPEAAANPPDRQSLTASLTTRGNRQLLDIRRLAGRARDLIQIPGPDEALHLVNDADLPGASVIAALVAQLLERGEDPPAVTIATLGANVATARTLADLLRARQLADLAVLGSVYFRDSDPEEARKVNAAILAAGGRIAYARTHAKIWILETPSTALTCEGSGNLRSCKNLEQLVITNSRPLAAFHRRWILDLMTPKE